MLIKKILSVWCERSVRPPKTCFCCNKIALSWLVGYRHLWDLSGRCNTVSSWCISSGSSHQGLLRELISKEAFASQLADSLLIKWNRCRLATWVNLRQYLCWRWCCWMDFLYPAARCWTTAVISDIYICLCPQKPCYPLRAPVFFCLKSPFVICLNCL